MKSLVVLLAILPMTACSLLGKQIDQAAKGAGKAVTFYCDNVTSSDIREEFRAKVNAAAAPNSIVVTCVNGKAAFKSN